MKYLFPLPLLLLLALSSCHSQDTGAAPVKQLIGKERADSLARKVPPARGFVNDFAGSFTQAQSSTLDSLVTAFEKSTSVEICIVTIHPAMVKRDDFDDYTLVMAQQWGVGKKDKNNGIVIAIAPEFKRIRIQNGYGIETILSDAATQSIINQTITPRFREGKYFEGTRDGVVAIIRHLKQNGL